MKTIGKLLGFALSIGLLCALVGMWGTLDTAYMNIPAASMTAHISLAWGIAVTWRAFISLIVGFILYGGWSAHEPQCAGR